jgi:hypothetical protein
MVKGMSKLLEVLIAFGVPLVAWLLVYVAVRTRLFDLNSMSRVLSVWRLLSLLAALPFLLGYDAASPRLSSNCVRYFWCFLGISLNLFLPQQWLRSQLSRADPR